MCQTFSPVCVPSGFPWETLSFPLCYNPMKTFICSQFPLKFRFGFNLPPLLAPSFKPLLVLSVFPEQSFNLSLCGRPLTESDSVPIFHSEAGLDFSSTQIHLHFVLGVALHIILSSKCSYHSRNHFDIYYICKALSLCMFLIISKWELLMTRHHSFLFLLYLLYGFISGFSMFPNISFSFACFLFNNSLF